MLSRITPSGRTRLPAPAKTWEERQARFEEFDRRVFGLLKFTLKSSTEITPQICRQVEAAIRFIMPTEAQSEMLCYTNYIGIYVDGRTWQTGWWFCKKTVHHRLSAEITFDPYASHLSVWTDPKSPDGIACFK